ncbi:MAG TPA: ABC transporter permease [Nitrososphaeraceae archaeon]|nr:ABC transporter permease [Nitrososphaeraceae archaeon]
MGLTGVFIFVILVCISVYTVTSVPLTSFREWNSPSYWVDYPASAAPSWTNIGIFGPRSPVHTILDSESADRKVSVDSYRGIRIDSYSFATNFDYDSFPTDFMIPYSVTYGAIPPVLEINVTRPDGREFRIFYSSLPPNAGGDTAAQRSETSSRIFSTDKDITKNLRQYGSLFNYSPDVTRPQIMLFSDAEEQRVLKGNYTFKIAFYLFDSEDRVDSVRVIIGGTVYGFLGTDAFRRDLAIGMLWGTPVALFIGLSVAVATSVIAMIYGVTAGYKGGRTDEAMMRINDFFISLPVLILLILISVRYGLNIFYIVILLILFGWAGGARLMRSLALQIKNFQYVEASKMMGESDFRIILRHIVPQLLPLTFASIAYAVPGAILAEAGLSFLGLSDLSIPTWGRILNEANSASAFTLGLWWWIVPPGLMIGITGLSFALIGYTLEYLTNPRRRTQLKRY